MFFSADLAIATQAAAAEATMETTPAAAAAAAAPVVAVKDEVLLDFGDYQGEVSLILEEIHCRQQQQQSTAVKVDASTNTDDVYIPLCSPVSSAVPEVDGGGGGGGDDDDDDDNILDQTGASGVGVASPSSPTTMTTPAQNQRPTVQGMCAIFENVTFRPIYIYIYMRYTHIIICV